MNRLNQKLLCLFLAICMGISPSIAMAASTPASNTAQNAFSYIVPDAAVAGVTFPNQVLTAPHMELMPVEIITAVGLQEWGFDPMDVESVTSILTLPSKTAPVPGFGVVILFKKPYSLDNLKPGLTEGAKKTKLDFGTCLKGRRPRDLCFFMPNDKTLLIATMPVLTAMLDYQKAPKKGPALPLVQMLTEASKTSDAALVVDVKTIAPLLADAMQANHLPPPLADAEKLPTLISTIQIRGKLTGEEKWSLDMTCNNENDAAKTAKIVQQLLELGKTMMLENLERGAPGPRSHGMPMFLATKSYTKRMSSIIQKGLTPTQKGKMLHWSFDFSKNQGIVILMAASFVIPIFLYDSGGGHRLRGAKAVRENTVYKESYKEYKELDKPVETKEAPPFPE